MNELIPIGQIDNRIFLIRGQRVMIDRDLAALYAVETKYLNRQVKRNLVRFPEEFMFQLNRNEKNELVTNWHRFASLKHSNLLPYAFNEYGVAMLASVLKSERAVKISIFIIKTFVRLRQGLASHKKLTQKIQELAQKVDRHDVEIGLVIKAIEKMIAVEQKPKRRIGFIQ